MRLPQDRILHIDTEFENDKVNVVAEWQGELVRCKDCQHYAKGHCYVFGGQMNDEDYCSLASRPQSYKYGDICPSGDCGICGRLENGDCLCNDGKPKKVRYKLHKPIEYVYIEFDEEETVQNITHECGGGTGGWK